LKLETIRDVFIINRYLQCKNITVKHFMIGDIYWFINTIQLK